MPTPAEIKLMGIQFAELEDPYIQIFIDLAALSVIPEKWEHLTEAGIKFLTLHLLTMALMSAKGFEKGVLGPVTSETVGGLSRSYGDGGGGGGSDGGDSDLEMTSWGRQYLRLQKSLVVTPVLVGGDDFNLVSLPFIL